MPQSQRQPLTDSQLRATPVEVELDAATLSALETINAVISDGGATVSIDDGGATITIDGEVSLSSATLSALETISAVVSGEVALDSATLSALETTELGATSLAALESITIVDGGGTISVDDGGGVLTVDGTVTANAGTGTLAVSGPLTDAQLRASAVSVEQATSVAVLNDQAAAQTNTLTAVSQARVFDVDGMASASLMVYGTYAGLTLLFEATNDGSNYMAVQGRNMSSLAQSGAPAPGTNASVMYAFDCVGYTDIRVTSLIGPSSGTANLSVRASAAPYVASGSVVADTELATAAQAADGTTAANTSGPMVRATPHLFNGTTFDPVRGDTTNGQDVDVTRMAALVAGSATIGSVGLAPQTSGGLTPFKSVDLDESEETVKASAGQLFGWYLYNNAATTHFVKLYNAVIANVTVGTTVPDMTIPVPAGSAANVSIENGIAFGTAISAAATTGVADNDTGAPAANAVVANFWFK